MSCTSYTLSGLNAQCKNSVGGIQEIYIGKYANLFAFEVDANKLATPVMHRGYYQKLFKYELRRNTASMTINIISNDNGTDYFETEVSLRFSKMETAKRIEVMALVNTDVFAIVKDRNGKYWLLGKDEPLQLTAAQGLTGNNRGDANEYTFTLTDTSNEMPFEVSAETMNDLFVDWCKEPLTIEIINDNTNITFFPKDELEYEYSMLISRDKETWVGLDCSEDDSVANHFGILHTGDKIYFMMREGYETPISGLACLTADDYVYVYGNIASILTEDYTELAEGEFGYDGPSYMWRGLFDDDNILNQSQYILTHPTKELVLPYTGMNSDYLEIYNSLFSHCTSMVYGPRIDLLPIDQSYNGEQFFETFYGCTSLKYLNIHFKTRPNNSGSSYVTTDWLLSANPNGIFVTDVRNELTVPRGTNSVPTGWKLIVVDSNIYTPVIEYDPED